MAKHVWAAMGAAILTFGAAQAGELRLGVAHHDLTETEDGVDVQVSYVFGPAPDISVRRYGVRPYLVGAANTEGHINFGGAGLQIEAALTRAWFAEFQGGFIVHDGRTKLPPPDQPILRQAVADSERTYGCDVLFHLSPAIGRQITQNVTLSVYWEHLSHGQILCEDDKNEGLDNLGVRAAVRF